MKSYAGNANSIADSILEILYNQDLTEKMVSNASRKVKELFNWTRIAEMTADVYEKSINRFKEQLVEDIPENIKTEKIQKESILDRLTDEKARLDKIARNQSKLKEA